MTKLLTNIKTLICLNIVLLIGASETAKGSETVKFPNSSHQYSSYSEFATAVCLPCHYRNIPNGTDLQMLLPNASEADIKIFLLPLLRDGNMPPNEVYRKILYNEFLLIK